MQSNKEAISVQYNITKLCASVRAWHHAWFLVIALTVAAPFALASEHGASAWPLGVEGVMTALEPPPHGTMLQNYATTFNSDELDDANGKSAVPDFKLHVVAVSIRLKHNWGLKFLGGYLGSEVAVPVVYENMSVGNLSDSRFSLTNTLLTPIAVYYKKGPFFYYYAIDVQTPGSGYAKANLVNIGQNYWSAAPVFGFTVLPNKGKTEFSDRTMYYVNDTDASTNYHSGNIFITEFSASQSVTRKIALGVGGSFSKQTTDDSQFGKAVVTQNVDGTYSTGYRSRDLKIGPTVRFPLGKAGAIIFKYYRDTLVQNATRGNAFWFQLGCPFPNLNKNVH
jgi:hypothetical protein